ncbi:hypothetical protein [Burkholderia cenocepacia]|uniref:hypothetical protein n=1 Tax=Burkholderia cenocepacia TaxID=95486 RepID=UPI001F4A4A27|nr:hypothetical protein [Burkholderia cenocepacia]
MHWMLTPYEKHADDGFGAMASAFKASAETLMAAEHDSIAQRELPICFLLRHAAELFLKSALVVSHRVLSGSEEPLPLIRVNGKDRQLTNIHHLGSLYCGLTELLNTHRAKLEARARTAWLPMPTELDDAITKIDEMDARGVFFRYPTENNSTKSNNKPLAIDDVMKWQTEQQGFLKAFFVVDENDQVLEAFRYDSELLKSELGTLTTACYWLNCIHVGLRVELAGGW